MMTDMPTATFTEEDWLGPATEPKHCEHEGTPLTFKSAAAFVLAEQGPMKVKDLAEQVLSRKLATTNGKTPHLTLSTILLRSPEFTRVAPGAYALVDRPGRPTTCEDCGEQAHAEMNADGPGVCDCGGDRSFTNIYDRAEFEPEQVIAEFSARGEQAFDAMMRDLGWNDLIKPKRGGTRSGSQHRCEWDGGYCQIFTSGKFCREHDPGQR